MSDLHTHTQPHPLSSSARELRVRGGGAGSWSFVSIPCCARIATRVWNTNEDRFRPRSHFCFILRPPFVLYSAFLVIISGIWQPAVGGSRQRPTASAIDSQASVVIHTHPHRHTQVHPQDNTHPYGGLAGLCGVRLFLVFVFARACLVFGLFFPGCF